MRPLRRDSCPTRFSLVIYTCAWHTYYQLKYQLKHFHPPNLSRVPLVPFLHVQLRELAG
jgi:hypothetical protein